MNSINVGDRVQWQERHVSRPYLHTEMGTVTRICDESEDWPGYAFVEAGGQRYYILLMLLTKVSAIEAVADDYAQLRVIGDLGGVELL